MSSSTVRFGHAFKKKYFPASDNGFVPANHGSFGLAPQVVVDKYFEAFYEDLASPDTFYIINTKKQYVNSLQQVASYLNCPYRNLALVLNASSGVNTILRSYPFKKGDKIALPNTTYGACLNTVKFLAYYVGIEPVFVQLDFPMSSKEVVAQFKKTFTEHNIKLALFDTVVSMPGVKLPFVEITRLCKEYNVLSLIDGAHSIGLIPIDLGDPDFQPDFYVSNLHKWLQVPRAVAVMYVAPQHHRTIQTMPISHSYVDPSEELTKDQLDNLLVSKFFFTGTESRAAVSCIPTALKFRQQVCGGDENIRNYCEGLARQAGDLALMKWPGTALVENEEKSLVTAMASLIIPLEKYSSSFDPTNAALAEDFKNYVSEKMVLDYNTYMNFSAHGKKLIFRLSANLYNELSDYEYAIDAAKKCVEAYFAERKNGPKPAAHM